MSRLSAQRQRLPQRQLLSDWAWDILSLAVTVIVMGAVLAMLFIEFPDGIRSLRDTHVGIVGSDRTVILNR